MNANRIAPLVAVCILTSCAEPRSPTSPAFYGAPSTVMTSEAGALRPFRSSCDTDIAILPPLVGDAPNVLRLQILYECRATHFGRATATTEQIVTFTSATTAVASSTGTYTTANGDQLFVTWSGTATSNGPDNTFSGTETFTGGTGRFAGASGSSWVSGTASFATMTGHFNSQGTLGY